MKMKHNKTNFDRYRDELLKDPKNKEIYEREYARLMLVEKIIELRKKRNLTQEALAKKVGMKQPVIARIESGRENPRYDTVARIFGALGATHVPVA